MATVLIRAGIWNFPDVGVQDEGRRGAGSQGTGSEGASDAYGLGLESPSKPHVLKARSPMQQGSEVQLSANDWIRKALTSWRIDPLDGLIHSQQGGLLRRGT